MKINKSKKLLFIGLAALTTLVVIGSAYILQQDKAAKNQPAPTQGGPVRELNSVDYSPPDEAGDQSTPTDPEPAQAPSPMKLDAIITAASQNQSDLQVRTLITSLISSGNCTITLAKTGQATISQSSSVVPIASTSTCDGFDIPLSSLSSGLWNVRVSVVSGNLTGSAEKDVQVSR